MTASRIMDASEIEHKNFRFLIINGPTDKNIDKFIDVSARRVCVCVCVCVYVCATGALYVGWFVAQSTRCSTAHSTAA